LGIVERADTVHQQALDHGSEICYTAQGGIS
jgi:hypothetical protein